MSFTTKQIVDLVNRLQKVFMSNKDHASKDVIFASNIAISKIDDGLAKRDVACFPIVAELLTMAFADKVLVALSACVPKADKNRFRKSYRDMITSKKLDPIVLFIDTLIDKARKKEQDIFLIKANVSEILAAQDLCKTLRESQSYSDEYAADVLLRVGKLISPSIAEEKPGGMVDTVFKNLFSGVGQLLGSMASSRVNYCVSNLVARAESNSEEERRFLASTLSAEIIDIFEESTSAGGGTAPVVDHIKAEFGQLRQAAIGMLSHMITNESCDHMQMELGDVIISRDDDGHSSTQLPIHIGERKYDLLMIMYTGTWSVGESLMFIPLQLQLLKAQ
ncbi:hypothetical protein BM525_19555 (plasmid) [Alteromonas mediterranea]|uniref:Uncharacterized protein n=1 Tax=Alteromonas mediterranea TaxID=314275 RepID=A0AAC9JGG6_9ALTE|nr:hypothetical protein [Alteromonas mediterranea]APD92081.1 hypothetical protein BM524_19360 [Alteromonas mediterranea]APD99935.1 hypothetical protein BM525_19555 [Alteromonas mediterranea]